MNKGQGFRELILPRSLKNPDLRQLIIFQRTLLPFSFPAIVTNAITSKWIASYVHRAESDDERLY